MRWIDEGTNRFERYLHGHFVPVRVDPGQVEKDSQGIRLRFPASYDQLPLVRTAVTHIAGHDNFDVDAIADIQVAVDEACSCLVARAAPGTALLCLFLSRDDQIRIRLWATTALPQPVRRDTFGWRVLSTLVDSVRTWVTPSDRGYLTFVELSRSRGGAHDGVSRIAVIP